MGSPIIINKDFYNLKLDNKNVSVVVEIVVGLFSYTKNCSLLILAHLSSYS